jgi:2-polyprenyl-6-methoxyphenol hydroxylase-like FAD-dependent oxidoreductase
MIPVVIVGGGPVGLVTSIYLSSYGIQHLLYERYPGTSIHPKAVGLNQRSIEILRALGLEEEINKVRAPRESYCRTTWYTSFGPDRKEILSRDAWGGGQYREEYERASPCPYTILPQIRLEPILLQRAKQLNPEGIIHNAQVVGIEEGVDSVQIQVEFLGEQKRRETVEAQYVVGADGGRTITDALGITMEGDRDIVDMVSAHFCAPISKYHPNPNALITWFINPAMGGSISTGYLYHLGPYPAQPETEEWVFACARIPDDPQKFEVEDMIRRINQTLQIPELDIQLISLSHWFVNAIVAEPFRSPGGRIFLAGDAAHRIPPWGALGLNTGLQDVQNLVWKLAMVLRERPENRKEYDTFLDTYEEERRPIALRVADASLRNLRNHALVMDRALGIDPNAPPEANVNNVNSFLDHTNIEGDKLRDAVQRAQTVLDTEFHAPGAEIGWFYPSLDWDRGGEKTCHGGQLDEDGEFDVCSYHPSSIPGHHLPHFWLQKGAATRLSTRDLVQPLKCVLFAKGPNPWNSLNSDLVHVEILDGARENWCDVDGGWTSVSGMRDDNGAILVRPDGIVIWRGTSQPEKCFDNLVKRLLKLPDSHTGDNEWSRYRGVPI